jgi:hypothetical protein
MPDRQFERGKEIIPPPPRPPYWLNEVEAIDEMGGLDTPLGVALWRILRSARLWVDGEPESAASCSRRFPRRWRNDTRWR